MIDFQVDFGASPGLLRISGELHVPVAPGTILAHWFLDDNMLVELIIGIYSATLNNPMFNLKLCATALSYLESNSTAV